MVIFAIRVVRAPDERPASSGSQVVQWLMLFV
jgi:hypothetical protein